MTPCRIRVASLAAIPILLTALLGNIADASTQDSIQDRQGSRTLTVTPGTLELEVGQTLSLNATVTDADGREIEERVFFFSRARNEVAVTPTGEIRALQPGVFSVVARTARKAELPRLSVTIPVNIPFPAIALLEFADLPEQHWTDVTLRYRLRAVDVNGGEREKPSFVLESSNPEIATADAYGMVTGHRPGTCDLIGRVEGIETTTRVEILPNPVARVEVQHQSKGRVRTGDVVHFSARATDAVGGALSSAPIQWSVSAAPDDQLGPSATGQIIEDGRFVAEAAGMYTVVATVGNQAGRARLRVEPRKATGRFVKVGHGEVLDVHTSDLWVWEGVDGRDYAITGTWGANGDALLWDVTHPAEIKRIASVRIDARTVNDVKVSADGSLAVLSREGASNRRNGIVLVDVRNPARPSIISTFDDQLTGGVHNIFIDGDTVYALSAGQRYDAIDISDRANPRRISSYEIDSPSHSIHDVWVEDGIAYSSNWSNGVHLVDVGNGARGGTPSNPVFMASYAYPSGWNHAAFPYHDAQTGKFWVVAGDEAFPYGLNIDKKPTYPRGWLHFIDFSDLDNPRELARYQVPEAGSHNYWIEDDVLYAAMYNGGVRAVDLSGDLLGDLYQQGREIAWFLPTHHEGRIPNAPMVWGPQPYKGHVFFSDWNSGLWCARLERPTEAR